MQAVLVGLAQGGTGGQGGPVRRGEFPDSRNGPAVICQLPDSQNGPAVIELSASYTGMTAR